MDKEIKLAPFRFQFRKDRIHARRVRDVARQDHGRTDGLSQRRHALLQRFALIGECDFGTLIGAGLGNAPGNGSVVGDTHDQAALAGHKAAGTGGGGLGGGFAHRLPHSCFLCRIYAADQIGRILHNSPLWSIKKLLANCGHSNS